MTKSVARMMRWFLVLLIIVFPIIWRYYPEKLPDFITRYRSEQFGKQSEFFACQSKESIDEMLVLYEKSKGMQGIDALTYLMTIMLDYGNWLDNNKTFIDQHPALKESLIEQLKNAVEHINSTNKDKQDGMDYFPLDILENYIKVLEDTTGQVKSIAKEFF